MLKQIEGLPEGINFPLALAPMVGLSHVALRLVVRDYLPDQARTIWPTEMLSSWKLPKEVLGQTNETFRGPNEQDLVPQILGNEEEPIRQSIQSLQAWGVEGVDINMGCPVRKALKHNYGVALMGDPEYAAEVVSMAARSSQVPVSVKLRAGRQNDLDFLSGFVDGLVAAGANWICLHPRVGEQKRRGKADWSQIGYLKKRLSCPVVGNGDVQNIADYHRMKDQTGCDLVMSGRGLAARPWMLWQLAEDIGLGLSSRPGEAAPRTPEEEGAEYGRALLRLIEELERYFTPHEAMKRLRFHLRMTNMWLDYGHSLMKAMNNSPDMMAAKLATQQFFSKPQRMSASSNLVG